MQKTLLERARTNRLHAVGSLGASRESNVFLIEEARKARAERAMEIVFCTRRTHRPETFEAAGSRAA